MKQIVMVYEALERGPANSQEIAAETGLPQKHVSALLSDLAKAGSIEKHGHPTQNDHPTKLGKKSHGPKLTNWRIKREAA